MVRDLVNFLTLMVIAVLVAGLVANASGTARVINAASDFMARGFAAQLGSIPTLSTGKPAGTRLRR
jgi:hypothetical protein